ncbi:enoyl-CoA hydratase/isomerase family protein [Flavisolibacter ginsengisoli]|jgi:enoyl-CoA hydratase|uniref:Enoyl-CoA hydratase n=1 Tax=Flavisolibacter ginsengisoli DSM 18119 TaxID=1121884 RepID=A0A1M5AZF5_9BACT|nr:enoyl-CoA hydratase-related protein [Flavisolibacter ginsengisoli]SHF35467.1 enoyl-CoA hydratase [Flavisolibacter ginsengisoli DSM 18119]
MYTTLLTSLENGIFIVTINRPDKLNALNKDVFTDLDAMLKEVENNAGIRGVIITGAGQKAFVAGADITEFLGLHGSQGMELARRGQEIFSRIEGCTKPVIAAVNGFALGGGCELAMACHIRIASENAKFGQPEVNLGLIPGYGGTQRLVQLIGKGRALELLMTAGMIDATTALQFGLVNHMVQQEQLLPKAIEILSVITSKAPLAISRCITAANAVFGQENGYQVELESFGQCFDTEDMKEGTTAFLEKRKANFKGK